MPTPDLYDNYGWRGPNNGDVKFEAPEKYLNKNRIKTYADLTKQRAQTLLDSVLKKNQEAEAEEAKQQQEKEQQNSGETEQPRPTVGDTPSGVLDGLIRPLSAQEQANRERAYAARQGVAGLGNGLAALANVLYTGAGATPQQIPDIPDAGGQQLMSWQERLKQDRYRQSEMDLAAQREAANDAYRAWQQQMAEKEFNQNVADTKWKQNFQESEAERDQKNIEDRNAETKRSNMANEKTNLIRAEKSGSAAGKGSSSGSSNNSWYSLKGYGGATVDVNATRINNEVAETPIGDNIPDNYKNDWERAKMGVGKSKTEVIQEAMRNNKKFQEWMIKNSYAQLSSVQDTQDDVLDFGDDEDVFNGSDFQ